MPVCLGIDYGTNALLVLDVSNGHEFATCVVAYPGGQQCILNPHGPDLARQRPGGYPFGLESSVRGALEQRSTAPVESIRIKKHS